MVRVRLSACLLMTAALVLPGCGGGRNSSAVIPAHQLPTAKSVSPASVPVPPMARSAVLPPSAMTSVRVPKGEIQGFGWTQLPGGALRVAASPDGSIWVLSSVGSGPDRSIWHYANGAWTNIPGAASRLAVGPDNTLWVLNSAGGIYAYNGSAWTGIAGGASEISVAADGSVYVISNQSGGPYGRGIYHYSGGTWTQMPGAAVDVAASWDGGTYPNAIAPGGYYVINSIDSLYYYNPASGYNQLPGGVVQLAPTTNGGVFALGYVTNPDGSHPIYYNDLSTTWTQQPGAAVSIATNATNVYAIGAAGGIYQAPGLGPPHQASIVGGGCGGLCQVFAPYTGSPHAIATGLNVYSAFTRLARNPSGEIIVRTGGYSYGSTQIPNQVSVYSPPFGGPARAVTNGDGQPQGIAVDPKTGTLFVSGLHPYENPTATITAYAPPYTGAPIATILSGARLMVVDSDDFLLAYEIPYQAGGQFGLYAYASPYTSAPVSLGSWIDGIDDMVVDYPTTNLFILVSNAQGFYVYPNTNTPVIKYVPVANGSQANRLAIDRHGNVFVAINGNGTSFDPGAIEMHSPPSYALSQTITTGAFLPNDIALDAAGNLFVVDYNNAGLRIYAPPYTGQPLTVPGITGPLLWLP